MLGLKLRDPAVKWVALWAGIYTAVHLATNSIRGVDPLLTSLIATFTFMFLWLAVIASLTRLRMSLWEAVAGLGFMAVFHFASLRLHFGFGADLTFLFVGAFLGYVVASLIREPGILLPVAIVAAVTDFWGVYYGPTHLVLQHMPQALGSVSAGVPSGHEVGPLLRVGFGDIVFLGLFLTCIQRFHMNYRGTFILLYSLLTATLAIVLVFGLSVPALVPMAIAVVTANLREFRLSRQEWLALLYVAAGGAAIFAVLLLTGYLGR